MATLRRSTEAALATGVWLLCGLYTARFLRRGWIPHDEGTIGQAAERVLSGQMPHRDFDEMYTGGLTYLHAGAIKLLGLQLLTPRLVLFTAFMLFLAAAYVVARRVAPAGGALMTLPLLVVWSVPNYFVSLPSWYNLFFATFGTLALLQFLDSRQRAWLLLAGFMGGLSLLMKITGLYFFLATFLFLVYVEHLDAASRPARPEARRWTWLIPAALAGLVILLLLQEPSFTHAVSFAPLFVAPVAACAFVAWQEWASPGDQRARVRRLIALLLPVGLGAVVALLPLLVLYWSQQAGSDLLYGVFVQSRQRLSDVAISPPGLATMGIAAPYAVLLLIGSDTAIRRQWMAAAGLGIALVVVLLLEYQPVVYRGTWALIRALPAVAVLAAVPLLSGSQPTMAPVARARVFLLVAMAAMVSLIQFPYATPTYFDYAAPATVLAIVAVVSSQASAPVKLHVVMAVFFLLFAAFFGNRSYGWNLGARFIRYDPDTVLTLERGGLVIPAEDARIYEELVALVRERAAGGTIYASPDCPEIYFLSGFSNPTHTFFDVLNKDERGVAWTSALLERTPIRAVVINTQPTFSEPVEADVQILLEQKFPQSRRIGRFIVRW